MRRTGLPTTTLAAIANSLTNEELGAAVRLLSHILTTQKPVAPDRIHVVCRTGATEWLLMRDAVLAHFVARPSGEISHALLESLALPGSAEQAGPVPPSSAAIGLVEHKRRKVPQFGQHDRPEIVSVRKVIFSNGVALFAGNHRSETTARSLVAGLIKSYREGDVAEALSAATRQDELADAYPWVVAWLRQNAIPRGTRPPTSHARSPAPVERPARPLATPEFLGISPARAEAIRARNRSLSPTKSVP